MGTESAKLFAEMVLGTSDISKKIDSLAKAIVALADAIDQLDLKLKQLRG